MPAPSGLAGLRSLASGADDAGTKGQERLGPRIANGGMQPPLPRTMTAMSWASSVGAKTEANTEAAEVAERYDNFPSTSFDAPYPGASKDKPQKMRRGWSNIASMFGGGFTESARGSATPHMGSSPKKPDLRKSITGTSLASHTSSAGNKSHSSNDASSSGHPVLRKGHSRMSFTSWKSGQTPDTHTDMSGTSSNRGNDKPTGAKQMLARAVSNTSQILRLKTSNSEEEMNQTGERHVVFDTSRVVVRPQALNDRNSSQPNKIRTARFTLLTWLPLSLFMQFRRVANMYFLLIVVLVGFPWSPKDWKSKVFPFAAVLLWTALKDLHEDRQRRRDDALENNQKTWRFDVQTHKFVPTMWQDVFAGDVLLISNDEAFPADMVLLHAGGSYEAYISTISLDGETNLKERRPSNVVDRLVEGLTQDENTKSLTKQYITATLEEAENEALVVLHLLHTHRLACKLGPPEAAVQDVKGHISAEGDGNSSFQCPVDPSCFLPRGCTLRNTAWVLALAGYIGDETKTRLNTAQSRPKVSNMQKYLNYCVWGLLIGLAIVCLYSATLAVVQSDHDFEFCCSDNSWLIRLAVFLITFYHVVPMSLYVVFEMLKLLLGYRVNSDPQMVCPETQEPAMARTADLIEEMGQINFVFSDKTGTLTRNEMVFAHACVDGVDLGDFRHNAASGNVPAGIEKVRQMFAGSSNMPSSLIANVMWFFTCLAVCHTVQVQQIEDAPDGQRQRYIGVSPDEVALVEAAREVSIVFDDRVKQVGTASSSSSQVVLRCGGETRNQVFQVLHELEFNSDRKRMSVVCEYEDRLFCLTKGADNVMEQLTVEPLSAESKDCLRRFSQQGFRTLVVAAKKVDREYYKKWNARYVAALSTLDDTKAALVSKVAAEMETSLFTVGITAVEDRLQDGVPRAIDTIKQAGVRVWVLTGDKTETAVDIAKSCLLFSNSTHLVYAIESHSTDDTLKQLMTARKDLEGVMDGGLVLDGRTIQYAMGNDECESLIFQLGLASCSCVCCRLTPLQKRQLVELVRRLSPSAITLAIGDGANDVPMIEGAHLGIAIRGKEGAQAVQVSDVAISQFRFLVPLLMCHGRRAYRRVAIFLCFYLYKNVALAMGDVVWMHQDNYRGRIAFPEYLSINYNVLFTSWHILFVIGYDYEVPDDVANSHPELYMVGPKRELFNWKVFSRWMVLAVYHGCVAWLIPNLWFGKDYYVKKEPVQFWVGSCSSFTIVILIVMSELLISVAKPFRMLTCVLPSLGALFMYVVVLFCLGYFKMATDLQPCMEKIPEELFKQRDAWISFLAVPAAVATLDVVVKMLRKQIWPSTLDVVLKKL